MTRELEETHKETCEDCGKEYILSEGEGLADCICLEEVKK